MSDLKTKLTEAYTHSRSYEQVGVYVRMTIELIGVHIEAWTHDNWGQKSHNTRHRIVPWEEIEAGLPPVLKLNIDQTVKEYQDRRSVVPHMI